jgi:PAS domain S-box-containing protein
VISHTNLLSRLESSVGNSARDEYGEVLVRSKDSDRRIRLLTQSCGYAAALTLPWFGASLSIRSHALQATPVALNFVVMAGITMLAGLGPGLVALVSTALIFNYYVMSDGAWSTSPRNLLRTAAILCIGFLIVWLCERQRVIRHKLRVAVSSLQVRTDFLMKAQQASNSVAWMFNTQDARIYWAEGGAEVFGYPFSKISASSPPILLVIEEDRDKVEKAFEQATQNEEGFHIEYRVRWPNGDIHWLESRGTCSVSKTHIWRGVTVDITDRKNAEFALVRSEKLAAIGRLSATIAHEINNPLEAVTNLLYLASGDPQLQPETRNYLEIANQELGRLGGIAQRTLNFARSKPANGPANLVEIVESVVTMFHSRCNLRGGEIRLGQKPDVRVRVPVDDLRQIFINIISNACDALVVPNGFIEVDIAKEGEFAVISISDNGIGIPTEHLSRVFEPFFTTKEDVGTGIGLWITKEMVEKSGGLISVHNDNLPAGFRTMFRVQFPTADQ